MLTDGEFTIYQNTHLNGLEPFLFYFRFVSYRLCQLVLAALRLSILNLNVIIFVAIFLNSDCAIIFSILVVSPRFLFCIDFHTTFVLLLRILKNKISKVGALILLKISFQFTLTWLDVV